MTQATQANPIQMIDKLRKCIASTSGRKRASNSDIAEAIGVNTNSIYNWTSGRVAVRESSIAKLEEALAKYGRAAGAKTKSSPVNTGSIRHVLGVSGETEVKFVPDNEAAIVVWTPVPYKGDISKHPAFRAAKEKLQAFLAATGIDPISPLSPVLTSDGTIVWLFVGIFPHKAPKTIIRTRNELNRFGSDTLAVKYATFMGNNNWASTFEPIIFDADGNIMDGQNRMFATRLHYEKHPKAPLFAYNVVFGVTPANSCYMGRGKKRTNKDQNDIEGRSFSSVRTRVLVLLHRLEVSVANETHDYLEESGGTNSGTQLEGFHQTKLNNTYGVELDAALDFCHGLQWGIGSKYLPKHIAAFMYLLFARKSVEAARYFVKSVIDGSFTSSATSTQSVREQLLRFGVDRTNKQHKAVIGRLLDEKGGDLSASQLSRGSEAMMIRYLADGWDAFCANRKGRPRRISRAADGRTTKALQNLSSPNPATLSLCKGLEAEMLAAIEMKAKAERDKLEKKMLAHNTDAGDVRLKTLMPKLSS